MLRRLRPLGLLWLALLGGLAAAQQAVPVPSLDQRAGQPLQLPGFWFAAPTLADASALAPALLLLHGCGGPYGVQGGLSQRMVGAAAHLNALGIGVLVTDSLTPRGIQEICTQTYATRQINQVQRRRDVQGALQWLAHQPGVDPRRLGLMGWSHGGSNVLASINQRSPEDDQSAAQASLAIALYPGCAAELQRGFSSTVPLLLLVGAADDWTPAAPCQALAAQALGRRPEIETYPGAYHGFDGATPVRVRKDVPNVVHPGQGVHVGADPAARAASRLRIDAFLRQQWQLAPP
ncbi:MAG: dienelactone hydrolase family protein [Rhodoferax sp.]